MTYRSIINGQSSEYELAKIIEERGPLEDRHEVPAHIIESYEGKVPGILLDFWENYGIGSIGDGRARFVIPRSYANVLEWLFRGDQDFSGDCHVIAMGAFGDMLLWSERYGLVFVTLPLAMVDAPFHFNPIPKDQVDQVVFDYVIRVNPEIFDTTDDDGEVMYERARANLGPLQPYEIYGTVPAIAFDEPLEVDRLARVEAEDWLIEKFTGTKFSLVDLNAERLDIRLIGAVHE